jgi:preprotein translocase subunit SecF
MERDEKLREKMKVFKNVANDAVNQMFFRTPNCGVMTEVQERVLWVVCSYIMR